VDLIANHAIVGEFQDPRSTVEIPEANFVDLPLAALLAIFAGLA
jgi:hypothetical protein